MRGREAIAMAVAALAVTAAFAIVRAPLPAEQPAAIGQGGVVVVSASGGGYQFRDCPLLAERFAPES
jgi:hypothetical protein